MAVLRVIKVAQRLGFTLDEVAELLDAGRHRHGRAVAGLQRRATAKLAEVEAKIANLVTIRDALSDAVAAGCDELTACAASPCCPSRSPTSPRRPGMPGTDLDRTSARARVALALLAGLACAACCLLPALITAGVVGAGASAVVGWLPVAAAVLAALALGGRWLAKRRTTNGHGCTGKAAEQGGCGCGATQPQQPPLGTRH